MTDIFREVDEDLRQQRLAALWKRFRFYLIGGAVLLVVATGGYTWWQDYSKQRAIDRAQHYLAAEELIGAGEPAAAATAMAEVAEEVSGSGYSTLARLQEAAALAAAGDRPGAVSTYDEIAADGGVPSNLRDLAALKATMQLFDSASADELRARLTPLSQDQRPWRYVAREMLAHLALKAGDRAAARQRFSALRDDPDAPDALRARAVEMLEMLGEPMAEAESSPEAEG